jgi:uncharacterized protein
MMGVDVRLTAAITQHPYPFVFATISGSHLYGFPSRDSDHDLRACHVLPLAEVVGLDCGPETIESSSNTDGFELDLVSHDVKKFMRLLLKKNGYVLEQLYSPLVVHSTPEHEELKAIGISCITRHHSHHYFGFAETQWRLLEKEHPRRVKPLLYVYRVLLTGIHLMRTGAVEANLARLNDDARLPQVADLIARKLAGPELSVLDESDFGFHRRELERLKSELEAAHQASTLPDAPTARPALNDLLLRLRLVGFATSH